MASSTQQTTASAERLARGLGWLSVGLGALHLAAPRALVRVIGLRSNPRSHKVMRAIGLRELTAGIGILGRPRAAGWLWARVGYDLSDLAILGSTLASRRAERGRVAAATAALLGVTALDAVAARQLDKFPIGAIMNRPLTLRSGQCHVQRYMRPLLERIQRGEIDPSFVITHRIPLDEAPRGFDLFVNKQDECMKVVMAA